MFGMCFILRDAVAEGNFNSFHLKLSAAEVSTVAINYWSKNLGTVWFVLMFYGSLGVWKEREDLRTRERNRMNEENEKDQ